jgi:tetratricopeptide (TPR) repeat protein
VINATQLEREQRFRAALAQEQAGDLQAAIGQLRGLATEAADSPLLIGHLIRALQADGQTAEAEAWAERAVRRWPTDADLHVWLAKLRWQRGDQRGFTAQLEHAIAGFPEQLHLRLIAANLWRNAGDLHRALDLAQGGLKLAPLEPAFLTSVGLLLEDLDRSAEALPYLRKAAEQTQNPRFTANLIPTLLRLGEAHEAQTIVAKLLRGSSLDQQLLAYQALAFRQLGQLQAYHELYDYERLVRCYQLFSDGDQRSRFNDEFARELLRLHRSDERPLDQSLRGGTQTNRNLPLANPVVARFFQLIDAPICDYISRLTHVEHVFDRRRRDGYQVIGSWSVALRAGGFHINHIHPMGWISSAYYVQVPELSEDAGTAGWLKFGEPSFALAQIAPDHFAKPEPGLLVLFPSYMWHGTVPIVDGSLRLTAAFDLVPV